MTANSAATSAGEPGSDTILIVDDSPGDVRLIQEALKAAKVSNMLHVMKDGGRRWIFYTGTDGKGPRHHMWGQKYVER